MATHCRLLPLKDTLIREGQGSNSHTHQRATSVSRRPAPEIPDGSPGAWPDDGVQSLTSGQVWVRWYAVAGTSWRRTHEEQHGSSCAGLTRHGPGGSRTVLVPRGRLFAFELPCRFDKPWCELFEHVPCREPRRDQDLRPVLSRLVMASSYQKKKSYKRSSFDAPPSSLGPRLVWTIREQTEARKIGRADLERLDGDTIGFRYGLGPPPPRVATCSDPETVSWAHRECLVTLAFLSQASLSREAYRVMHKQTARNLHASPPLPRPFASTSFAPCVAQGQPVKGHLP